MCARSKLFAVITCRIARSTTSRLTPCWTLVAIETISPCIGRYNKLCGSLRSFAQRVALLPPQDPFRSRTERQILAKLYDLGLINTTTKLSDVENTLTVAAFCRRRLAVILCTSKMAQTVGTVHTHLSVNHLFFSLTVSF